MVADLVLEVVVHGSHCPLAEVVVVALVVDLVVEDVHGSQALVSARATEAKAAAAKAYFIFERVWGFFFV